MADVDLTKPPPFPIPDQFPGPDDPGAPQTEEDWLILIQYFYGCGEEMAQFIRGMNLGNYTSDVQDLSKPQGGPRD